MEHSYVLNWRELSWGKHSYHTQNLEWEHNYLSNSNRYNWEPLQRALYMKETSQGVRTSPGVTGTLRFKGEWRSVRSHCKVPVIYMKAEKSLFLEKQQGL